MDTSSPDRVQKAGGCRVGPDGGTDLPFFRRLVEEGVSRRRGRTETVQINLGRICNQSCTHCHVNAGPKRAESMERDTARRVTDLLERSPGVGTVDLTGGAPELNPWFRFLVSESKRQGKQVIDRCNLTVFFEKGQEDLAPFLREHEVEVVASLPCYTQENVDRQRGRGVFAKSVRALRELNRLGYGREGTGLDLSLVYNPGGPGLPPSTEDLEEAYRTRLLEDHGIVFTRLLTLTNVPIHRFRARLLRRGELEEYRRLLRESFNPVAAEGVMCRTLVSVGWDGMLYDCDFNQMLELPLGGRPRTIHDVESFDAIDGGEVAFGEHCFACTAGAGSSCTGAIV
ncbi:MAG: arsenosugar biosynthesis radical SAM protein ArsS [Thermoanaerobaculia bacterium]|nr:arsenosugar biosynthesis radical SAM protein ArsS [Thermoanaerobaculia bacterium]